MQNLRVPESALQERDKKASTDKEEALKPQLPLLAAYISGAYEAAVSHREASGVTERLTECRRLKKGVYGPEKLAQIRAAGSSDLFYNLTESKCEAFVAWMTDVFFSGSAIPWGISPTPIPSLSAGDTQALETPVVEYFTGMMAQNPGYKPSPEEVREFTANLYDEGMKVKIKESKGYAERMEQKINDQTEEGGYLQALSEFISDLGDYPTAFFKGPVFKNRKRLKWVNGAVQVQKEAIPTWCCVDPFNAYPGPHAKTVNDSYFCEVIDYDRADLSKMRGLPGWSTEKLNEVLNLNVGTGTRPDVPGESEMNYYDNANTLYGKGAAPDATIRGVEFWGNVQGKALHEWGMDKKQAPDENEFYQVTCILINSVVVKAILNPHPLGHNPYYATSFSKSRKSVWGNSSIPEKLKDCQDGVNVCQRNLLNNLAMSSGPMVAFDIATLRPEHADTVDEIYPWKMFLFDSNKGPNAREAVKFFQPQSNAQELQSASEFYELKADDRTLIPRYVTGDQDMSGAAATASGLSMLMSASARGIKRVIRNTDQDVIRLSIQDMYIYNMLHSNDDSIKGDAQVVAKGAVAMLVKEQTQLRRQEFLNLALSNQTVQQILGTERIANLLRSISNGLDMDEDSVVPSEQEIRAMVQNMEAIQQQESEMQQQAEPVGTPI